MKMKFKRTIYILFATLFVSLICLSATINADNRKTVEIIFTHDIHSFVDSYKADVNGTVTDVGGFARLSTFISERKKSNENILLVDAGDLSMGTLYQALFETDAVEMSLLSKLGFDATTFGNHDFDIDADALANMYREAAQNNSLLTSLVCCNIDWNYDNEYTKTIYEAAKLCNLNEYVLVTKGDSTIAITGVFTKNAILDSPTCKLHFLDEVESLKRVVADIKANTNADMIVCVSHGGTSENFEKSADEQIALAVPELDVIVSGHSHTVLKEPKIVGDTHIVSCGCYGLYVGDCILAQKENGRFELVSYNLQLLDSSIKEDDSIKSLLAKYQEKINSTRLAQYNLEIDQVIAHSNFNFESVNDMYNLHTETRLGNLMSDAYLFAANNTEYGKEHPFDFSVVPAGTVRGSFFEGDITAADAFQCYSLGQGADKSIGHPLIELYLTGKEVKAAAELDASLSDLLKVARLYFSGINMTYNPHRTILNKLSDISLNKAFMGNDPVAIDDNKLYHVVTDMYTANMLGLVESESFGLLSIVPKDEFGTPIEDLSSRAIILPDGNQLKAWVAITSYLSSFEKNKEGVSEIPAYYNELHNRKVCDNSYNPINLIKNPNKYFFIVNGIIILLIAIIVLIIIGIAKLNKIILKKNIR